LCFNGGGVGEVTGGGEVKDGGRKTRERY